MNGYRLIQALLEEHKCSIFDLLVRMNVQHEKRLYSHHSCFYQPSGTPEGWPYNRNYPGQLAQRTNLCIKTAFITSCLVLVDQTLAGHMIKNRNSFLVRTFRSALVATCNGRKDTLNHGAHHRALAGVTLTRFFGLANAFARLGSVGHGLSSGLSVLNSAAHYPPPYRLRQRLFA